MEKITLAINKEGEPYFGAIFYAGDGKLGASAVGFGIDAGARLYKSENAYGLTAVIYGKECLGIHIKRSHTLK